MLEKENKQEIHNLSVVFKKMNKNKDLIEENKKMLDDMYDLLE